MAVVVIENELAGLAFGELVAGLAEQAADINAALCRLLGWIAELDRRQRAGEGTFEPTEMYVAWKLGLGTREARQYVEVARRLERLPSIREAFARGELSFPKVRALLRVAEPESDAELLALARQLTATQLEGAVRTLERVTAAQARGVHDREFLYTWWDEEDGSLNVRGRLSPEVGRLFQRALEATRDALGRRADREWWREQGLPPEPPPTGVEALVAMSEAALGGGGRSGAGGDRYEVVVHVEADALTGNQDHGASLEHGPALSAETVQRIACDASVVTLVERDGRPLSVGRKTRTVPTAIRRALRTRDQGCCFPGCNARRYLQAHHIEHWARGGETTLANLMLLCGRHHRLLHEGAYTVDLDADGDFRFWHPRGHQIDFSPLLPRGDPNRLSERERETPRPIDDEPDDLDVEIRTILQALG